MSLEEPVQDVDVSMKDVIEEEEEEQEVLDTEKIKILPGATEDGTAASFQITEEDHTLGNALRYIIMKKWVPRSPSEGSATVFGIFGKRCSVNLIRILTHELF